MKRLIPTLMILAAVSLARAQDSTLREVKSELEALKESLQETKGIADKLAKIKVSGYLQLQWQHADSNGIGSVAGGNFPSASNQRLQLRRGRLKTAYDAGTSQYILELEVLPSGVSLKDAEIVLLEPWLKTFALFGGVMDRPFGFEIMYSSSAHEAPERTRVYQTVFPGEKDLGLKLEINPNENMGFLNHLNFKGGLFTGTAGGSTPGNAVAVAPAKAVVRDSTGAPTKDTVVANLPTGKTAPASNGDEIDSSLDFIGRLGFKAPFNDLNLEFDGGISMYLGKSYSGNDTVYQMQGETALVPTAGNKNKAFDRQAFGVDAQIYYDIPFLGGMSLRGEYLQGTMPGTLGSSKNYGTSGSAAGTDYPGSYMATRNFMGWYASWIQNFGKKFQTVVKYDVYDPNTDVEGSAVGTPAGGKLSVQDLAFQTFGLGLIYYWDANLRFTGYYDIVTNEEAGGTTGVNANWLNDLSDNVLTFRAQVKF